jgi:hypothetical protein
VTHSSQVCCSSASPQSSAPCRPLAATTSVRHCYDREAFTLCIFRGTDTRTSFFPDSMMRPITTLCLLWLACDANACGFDSFNELNKILGSCCESTSLGNAKASRDCSQGFPNTCTLACADRLVPFYADCHTMMSAMPASNFKFKLKELDLYVQHCQHTRELLEYSASTTTCAANAKAKEQRVLDVSAACCSHKGKFTCKNSVPWSCTYNALSALHRHHS